MGKMGKTFVVLVSLYIGLVSGFIVPSGAPEVGSKCEHHHNVKK